jgi:AraC-like DNA-binding protein
MPTDVATPDVAVPGYRQAPPPAALAPFVRNVWTNVVGPGDPGLVLPDGSADLIWVSGRHAHVFVAGPDTGPRRTAVGGTTTFAGVRFRPGAAAALLGVPMDAVVDASVPVGELWGPALGRELAERVAAGERPEQVLTEVVARRRAALPDAEAGEAIRGAGLARALRAEDGPGAVARVAASLGMSERQLHRRSRTLFGYGPKTLQRVLRFEDALRLARGDVGLARAAADAGYADQAHLAREARALAGTTLTDLLA